MLKASGVIKIHLARLVILDVRIQIPIFLKQSRTEMKQTDSAIDNNESRHKSTRSTAPPIKNLHL